MNVDLPAEVESFSASAQSAFVGAGGIGLARAAEVDEAVRRVDLPYLLDQLGASDIEPMADLESTLATAELCRVAGVFAIPYPIEGMLLSPAPGQPFGLVSPASGLVTNHGDLAEVWTLASTDGTEYQAVIAGRRAGSRLGPFLTSLRPSSSGLAASRRRESFALLLSTYRILGTLERALALTIEHVNTRIQFGKPLAAFQAVRFQLADVVVDINGLREHAHYTSWALHADIVTSPLVDSLALRGQALEAAQRVLHIAHQLHGAVGFCDEHELSVLTRHLQPYLRLPDAAEVVWERLLDEIGEHGISSLFSEMS